MLTPANVRKLHELTIANNSGLYHVACKAANLAANAKLAFNSC